MASKIQGRRRPSSISSISSRSSEASRDSLEGLLESPLPSPSLPTLTRRKSSPWRPRNILRLLLRLSSVAVALLLLLWGILWSTNRATSHYEVSHLTHDGDKHELVGDSKLPEDPMPVIVTDNKGKTKWTVSIPASQDFPLKPSVYSDLCTRSKEISDYMLELKGHHLGRRQKHHFDYYHVDQNFMDVSEAEDRGLLPPSKATPWNWKSMAGVEDKEPMGEDAGTMHNQIDDKVCEKSVTFVLETRDAGFGKTMMGLWMAYGLAVKEGRAFFIDDRYWAYGKYSTYFAPPSTPSCLPPPDTHKLPCPHHARHLLVSAATVPWAFGGVFNDQFEDARKVGVLRQEPIFSLLRTGFEGLFRLASKDAEYVDKRIEDLGAQTRGKGGILAGIHVRHGDRHPKEYQYQKSYIPLEKYVDHAREFIVDAATDVNGTEDLMKSRMSKMVLASDDPEVYASVDMSHALRAQEVILMASKAAIDKAAQGKPKPDKFVEDNLGWEGGFYSDVFWALGDDGEDKSARALRKRQEMLELEVRDAPSPGAMQLRSLVGRAYVMDLAVVGRTDRVVCGVNSTACRLLAVMMGWDEAIVQGRWKNIDGDFDWNGIEW